MNWVVATVGMLHRFNGVVVDDIVGVTCDVQMTGVDRVVGTLPGMQLLRTTNLTHSSQYYDASCLHTYKVYPRATRRVVCNDPYNSYQRYLDQSRFKEAWEAMTTDASSTFVVIVDAGIGDHFELPIAARFPLATENLGHHATYVAGTVASSANGVALCGASPYTQLVDINLLARDFLGDASEALAFTGEHGQWKAVYCNSWGPLDDGRCEKPGHLLHSALDAGIENGRGGYGNIYIFAAGNGGKQENMNDDGYANLPHTISVAALNGFSSAYFSEWGSAITLSAPGYQMLTTSTNNNFAYFSGTSASAPLVAAAASLIIATKSDLSWRDVQEILMMSAAPVGSRDDFRTNAARFSFSHVFGAGQLDAHMAVKLAARWQPLPTRKNTTVMHSFSGATLPLITVLPIAVSLRTEHVRLCINATHRGTRYGDGSTVGVVLISPSGTRAVLAKPTTRVSIVAGCSYDDWCFTSLVQWGEPSEGMWKVSIEDIAPVSQELAHVSLTVFGSDATYGFVGCRT